MVVDIFLIMGIATSVGKPQVCGNKIKKITERERAGSGNLITYSIRTFNRFCLTLNLPGYLNSNQRQNYLISDAILEPEEL